MTDRCQLVEETLTDVTLQAARALANTSSEEYMWDDGMLFKCQLEPGGSEVKRLCLPISVRERCTALAHGRFQHFELVVNRLLKFGLKIRPNKCQFIRHEVGYLGFVLML